jgi:hypothetical protein
LFIFFSIHAVFRKSSIRAKLLEMLPIAIGERETGAFEEQVPAIFSSAPAQEAVIIYLHSTSYQIGAQRQRIMC